MTVIAASAAAAAPAAPPAARGLLCPKTTAPSAPRLPARAAWLRRPPPGRGPQGGRAGLLTGREAERARSGVERGRGGGDRGRAETGQRRRVQRGGRQSRAERKETGKRLAQQRERRGQTERADPEEEPERAKGGERAGGVGGEKERELFTGLGRGPQSRSIAHTVPCACPASASPECPPSGLNSAAHARFSACRTQEGRSGGGLRGLTGRGIQDGHRWGLALPLPLDGMEDPGREKREGGHRGGRGQGQPTRPGRLNAWGVGGWGVWDGGHTAHRWGGAGRGTTELKTEPKKGRKNRNLKKKSTNVIRYQKSKTMSELLGN